MNGHSTCRACNLLKKNNAFFQSELKSESPICRKCIQSRPPKPKEGYTESPLEHEMLPCPFCGCTAIDISLFPLPGDEHPILAIAECQDCEASLGGDSEELAVENWNRRVCVSKGGRRFTEDQK